MSDSSVTAANDSPAAALHTALDELLLLCGHHHRTFDKLGWTVHTKDGQPEWIPPPWLTRYVA
jgi:hypothetical protein